MDRSHLIDRLPTRRIRESLPGVDAGDDSADLDPESDGPTEFDPDTVDEADDADDAVSDPPEDDALGADEDTPSRRAQARKLLLGVSLGGVALAAVAALLRRLLGNSEADDTGIEVEPEPEPDSPAPDAETVAATLGLAFLLVLRALVGEDEESESPTT